MRAVFITEGKKDIGFGHVTRCLSISQAFKEKKITSLFLVNGDESILSLLKNENLQIIDWIKNEKEAFKLIKNDDIVFVDSYLAKNNFYKRISQHVKLAIYIDDNNRLSYPKGIVLNGNVYATFLPYPKKKDLIYLLGPKYAPIRKEFWDFSFKNINKKVKNILVTFGGDDKRNLTPRVLSLLQKNYPDISCKVIVGNGFKNKLEIIKSKTHKTELFIDPNPEQIKELMINSDIVISASGQTTLELLRLKIPAIIITVADNQENIAKILANKHLVEFAGNWKEKSLLSKLNKKVKKLINYKVRKVISDSQENIVDGCGPRRIAKFVMSNYLVKELDLRKANIGDLVNVYKLSNEKLIRKNSLNQGTIVFEDHIDWFKKFISNRNNFFIVAYFNKILIGQVRFEIKNNSAIISISISKNFQSLGLGQHIMLQSLVKLKEKFIYIKEIIAVVKINNKISQRFFLNNNFKIKQIKKDIISYTYSYDF